MFIQRLLNQGNAPLLERMVRFTSARQGLLLENISNADTPDYQQKDLSLKDFQASLQKRVAERKTAAPGSVGFDDLQAQIKNPRSGLLFHDRNNRSMEQLMSDMASNGMRHNMYTELLRKSYDSLHNVLKDRIA